MSDYKTISLKCGVLKGLQIMSKLGKNYVAFKGIPYAKPPVGNLRFKPPEPLPKWEGVRDATKEGNRAPHFDMVSKEFCGNEDCLYLNIYSPEIPEKEQSVQLKPVMFWIHGGGFAFGHGDADVYGPDLLVQHDVILVTVNYRLGVLGFLNLELEEASGNMGMKDQVAALRWVQKEIETFGGDPNNITIFGNSAGGASVHLHMLSDMSKGLFQKAIAQSGNSLCPWSFTSKHKERAFKLGRLLGLETKDEKELLNFFRAVPAVQFARHQDEVTTMADHVREVDQAFVPSVEKKFANIESFISVQPKVLLESGKLNSVPLLTGVNSHEGLAAIFSTKKYPQFIKEADSRFHNLLPISELNDEKVKKVRDFYFSGKHMSENEDQLIKFYTDIVYLLPTFETIKLLLNMKSHSKIFLYHFSYDGKFGWYKQLMAKHRNINKENIPSGTHHCDELGYLFSNDIMNLQNLSEPSAELKVANMLTTIWTNFAKTGESSVPDSSIKWPPTINEDQLNFLNISESLSLGNDSVDKRIKFWKELGVSISLES